MTIEISQHFVYLIEQIRSNLAGNEPLKETPRAHAWLLTTLSLYGDQFEVLIDLYRLFREQSSYILLSFIIEHLLQYHLQHAEKNSYLQQEFQSIFSNGSCETEQFSYVRLHSLLSSSTREIISSLLLRKWYNELEENLLSSSKSIEILNQCREKSLACLTLSSSSIPSILQLILNIEKKISFTKSATSLNILRCLFVQDLLPLVLDNRQKLDIQSHVCHQWLISAIEFYLEYFIHSSKFGNSRMKLHGSENETFYCENPMESIEKLLQSSVNIQENFHWQEFSQCIRSSNRRQRLLELRLLINCRHQTILRCPFECCFFVITFPIYIQSMMNLSKSLENETYRDHLFLFSTTSIKRLIEKDNFIQQIDFIEHFHLFMEILKFFQQLPTSTCVKLYQDMIDNIHLHTSIPLTQRILKIFYFYYTMEKSRQPKQKQTPTITIDDTPQSPESIQPIDSPLICPDLEHLLVEYSHDQSIETRLQLCMLYSLTTQKQRTVSFCIETLINLHDHYSSQTIPSKDFLVISSDYSFLPLSYPLLFNYLLDLLLEQLPPTLILLQWKSSSYSNNLFSTLTPPSLRYIYDQKLLGQFLHYIQTSHKSDRRWLTNTNKRKLDSEQNKLTDEQFIEKIIQHVSHVTQWTDEQRRSAIYTYIIDERQALLQSI